MKLKSLLIAGITVGGSLLFAETVTMQSLLKQMPDRKVLTEMPKIPYKAKMWSSYDRASKVNNPADGLYVHKSGRDWGKGWFANSDFKQYIRIEENEGRKEYVLMEDEGPGALVRWWGVAYNKGNIRIYLDGAKEPVVNMKFLDLVGGDGLVGFPLSFKASDDKTNPVWRGLNLYLPIPYAKSCKVTYDQVPEYYQINFNKFDAGTDVKTFTMEDLKASQKLVDEVNNTLKGGNKDVKGEVTAKNAKLQPGQSLTVKLDKPGAIAKLCVQLAAKDYKQALRSTVIDLSFDGKKTLWMPVGSFGGVGYSEEVNDTYYVSVDPKKGEVISYYQMPFQKDAVITITNHGEQEVDIKKLEVTKQPYNWTKDSLYFHGTWFELRNISTLYRSDLNYVTVRGKGRYVGTSITIFNTDPVPSRTWWGEGDDKFYVDGETFPSIFGTGTEDYFGYAFCRPQRYNLPFISQPRGEGNKKWGYTNNNRYHFIDDVPFNKSLKFDMEIWHPWNKNMNYAAATFFYADKGSTNNIQTKVEAVKHKVALTPEDVLNVGK